MITEIRKQGVVIRVRLTPNSSSCILKGIFEDAEGDKYLKINVVSVPEKGKANAELIKFIASKLKVAKSDLTIVSGETDRYKKLLVEGDVEKILCAVENWLKGEGIYE